LSVIADSQSAGFEIQADEMNKERAVMREKIVHPYVPNSAPEVKAAMLKEIGVEKEYINATAFSSRAASARSVRPR